MTTKAKLQTMESQVREASLWWRQGGGGAAGHLPVVFLSILASKTHSDHPHLQVPAAPGLLLSFSENVRAAAGNQRGPALCVSGKNRDGREENAGEGGGWADTDWTVI